MKVELTRKMIIHLLLGCTPSVEAEKIVPYELGDVYIDGWRWDILDSGYYYWLNGPMLEKYPDEYLYNLYLKCTGELPITKEDVILREQKDEGVDIGDVIDEEYNETELKVKNLIGNELIKAINDINYGKD